MGQWSGIDSESEGLVHAWGNLRGDAAGMAEYVYNRMSEYVGEGHPSICRQLLQRLIGLVGAEAIRVTVPGAVPPTDDLEVTTEGDRQEESADSELPGEHWARMDGEQEETIRLESALRCIADGCGDGCNCDGDGEEDWGERVGAGTDAWDDHYSHCPNYIKGYAYDAIARARQVKTDADRSVENLATVAPEDRVAEPEGVTGKYRKRPIVIEAFQMTRDRRVQVDSWPEWLRDAWSIGARSSEAPGGAYPTNREESNGTISLFTLEGAHLVSWGDWIIRGVTGELYACKDEHFKLTYDPWTDAENEGAE